MLDVEPASPAPCRVAIVGAGALGTALALRLLQNGYTIDAVISRTEAGARRLAGRAGAPVASAHLADVPRTARVVFCCVPDDRVTAVAAALAEARRDWSGCTVAHMSGALTTQALAPLAARGARALSFHPVQTFPPGTSPEAFSGIYIGLEGDADAIALGARLAADLGARHVVIPPEKKALYHLAASCASNFLVTLMALTGDLLVEAGIERQTGMALVRPLVERTWQNIQQHAPEHALTGPIARGDRDTMARHAEALAAHVPHLLSTYVALATETVHLAVRAGRLTPDVAERLLGTLPKRA